MASGGRGLGVTQNDLDASRLVFVSVKDAKPKRKVAVPIPENGNWESFIGQVKTKLKLSGIGEIILATTGEKVKSLDQLQDIDELYVSDATSSHSSNGISQGPSGSLPNRYGVADSEITPEMSAEFDADADQNAKYAKRQSALHRTMKRAFPALFSRQQQQLPITTKDTVPLSPVEQVRRRIKKRKRSWIDPRTFLIFFALVSCIGTLLFIYLRTGHELP